MCQDVTMLTTFPIKFKLFHSKISCYLKFPSVPAPNTLSMTSHNTHSYLSLLHSRETKDLKDKCMSQEGCEELSCETVIHSMAEPKIIPHFTETSPREERAADSPASGGVLSNRGSLSNWGLQAHCWVGFFHFLPLLAWLTVAVGSVCTLHRTSPARAAMPAHIVPRCQVCRAPAGSQLNGPGVHGQPKVMVWVSALPNPVRKHRRAKQRPEDFPSPESRQKPKYGTGLGFIPCLLKEIPPHSPLPSPLVLGQLHLVDAWELGFIQHLKICLLRLLLQALANIFTNKHLPVKVKMEILIN